MNTRSTDDRLRSALRSAAPAAVPPQLLETVTSIPRTHAGPVARPRPWLWARLLFPVAVAAIVMVALVSTFVPNGPEAAGGPRTSPTKSAELTTTPRPVDGATVVCGEVPHSYKGLFVPFLTCEPAIAKAITAVPSAHPVIDQLEFGYGDYCRPADPCPTALDLLRGYVLVTYQSGSVVLVSVADESLQSGVTVRSVEPLP